MPGTPSATAHFLRALDGVGDGTVLLDEAWMLRELVARDAEFSRSRVKVANRWCRVDPHVPRRWHDASRTLANREAEALGVEIEPADDSAPLAAPVGLAIENRARAAMLATATDDIESMAQVLLPAMHPVALGLDADATRIGAAMLRDACRHLGVEAVRRFEFDKRIELPRRVKTLVLGDEEFHFSWSRARGTRWRLGAAREAEDALALEVQGDLGGRGPFEPGLPERARRFLASDFAPVCKAEDAMKSWVRLERELVIPEDPSKPRGRKRPHDASLEVQVDRTTQSIEFTIALSGLLPRHRYRLCVPLPFWPRPARYSAGGVEHEVDGPWCATAVDGRVEFVHEGQRVVLEGSGVVEAEVYPRRNDLVCAVTLARVADECVARDRVERSFRLALV